MKTNFKNLGIQLFLISLLLLSCKTEKKPNEIKIDDPKVDENVISIVTQSMEFQMVDTIPSGWNTFVYKKRI